MMTIYKPWHDKLDAAQEELERRIARLRNSAGDLNLSDLFPIQALPRGQLIGVQATSFTIAVGYGKIKTPEGREIDHSRKRRFDFSGIEELQNLQKISLRQIIGSRFESVSGLTKLKTIDITFCDFDPTEGLSRSQNLEEFSAKYCKFTSLRELRGMKRLRKIVASSTEVRNLGELGELPSLVHLDVSKTKVGDISHILNFPRFANEMAEYLDYSGTPAANVDNRLNMVGHISPKQSAIQTVQYLKGTHPDFKSPDGGALGARLEDRLRSLSPVKVVERSGVISVENQSPVEHEDEKLREQRIEQLTWLCAGFLDDASHAQCPQQIIRRVSRLLVHLRGGQPIYYIIDSALKVLSSSVDDPFIHAGLDAGLVETLKEMTEARNWLRPLMTPPPRISEITINSLPDLRAVDGAKSVSDLASQVANELSDDCLKDDIDESVKLVADELKNEAGAVVSLPPSVPRLKLVASRLSGFVSFLSSVASIHSWVVSPAGSAFVTALKRILDELLSFFRG